MKGFLSLVIIAFCSACQPTQAGSQLICASGFEAPAGNSDRWNTALFLQDVDFDGPPPLNFTYFLSHGDSSFFDGFSFNLRDLETALAKYNQKVYPLHKLPSPDLRGRADIGIKYRTDWSAREPLPFDLTRLSGASEIQVAGSKSLIKVTAIPSSQDADISLIWCRDVPSGSLLRRPCPGLELDPEYRVELENRSGRSVSAFVLERTSGKTVGDGRDRYYGYQLWVKPSGKATCSLISDGNEADTLAAASACIRRRLDVDAPLSFNAKTIPLTALSGRRAVVCD
jgi:hypothetical protein